jgi:DNA invertase Pin-like site-specific DNA recombinase
MPEAWSDSSLLCQPGSTQLDVPRERQREGIAIAKKARVYKGRKLSLSAEQVKEIRRRVKAGEQKTGLAPEYGVSRADVVLCAGLGTAPGLV